MQLSLQEIANTLGANSSVDGATVATGYSIDSRTIAPGDCFFAVRGAHLDGHDYVAQAIGKGACVAVIAEELGFVGVLAITSFRPFPGAEVVRARVVVAKGSPFAAAAKFAAKHKLRALGVESEHTTLAARSS